LGKIKILHVIDRLNIGGAEKVFLALTKLLLDEGLHVDTLLISEKGPLFNSIDPRAKQFFLNRKFKFSIFKLIECASICAHYDIVHVHMRFTYTYVKLAQLITRKKFKIIFHDHGDREIVPIGLRGLFKPEFYIGVSQRIVDWSVSSVHVKQNNSYLLRNIVITTTDVKLIDSRPDWVMVSNIREIKNIELAIRLAHKLKKKLFIYGNAEKSSYSERILKLIQASSFVRLIQGESEVQQYFVNFKIAIHTAHSETGPLVLIEYLARGLPFLSHLTGEVANVLKKEIPECFIDTLDIDSWIEKLLYLQRNPPSTEKLICLLHKYFGAQQYSEQCLKIYQKVVGYS
jgi:glycosyltransferase involved in cell wall biosynthesis